MDWRDYLTKMALKLGPALLILISFVALLVGVILHGISISEIQYRSPPANHFKKDVIIGDKLDNNLIWFLQVTDLHISNRGNFDRQTDFIEFSRTYMDIVKPDVVLVTGDITDGRKPNTTFGTGPQLDEWLAYYDAITKTNAINKTKWIDIRGNHDNFNVYRPQDPNNLYRKYSIMGKNHSRNFCEFLEKGTGSDAKRYTFIGVDEVQTPGLKIPFNFIGIVKDEDLTELKRFKELAKDQNSEYTIWLAHYPTSSIASPNEGLRNIIDGPYLCGHYHTIGNWVTQMHATQQPGYAEVELGDWKYNRRLRLASVDHQLFNFVDVGFKEFPIALMTNPKKSQFLMPKYEPVGRIKQSTHIRVLAFSNAHSISKVTISIDGDPAQALEHSSGPLWVLKWDPNKYPTGLHSAKIYVEDSDGKHRIYDQEFSLDFSKKEFSLGARILLRAYFRTSVMSIFYFTVSVCALPLLILRLVSYKSHEHDTGLKRHYKGTFLYKLHLLSNIKQLSVPLIIIPIWVAVGPLFIGYLVDEALGACFVWGVLTDGTFIYTGITFNVASLFLLFVHVPEVILLTYQVSSSYKSLSLANKPSSILSVRMILHIAVTMIQLWMGSLLYSAYGGISFLTSFTYLWCIFIYAFCWYRCTKLSKSDFASFERTENSSEQQPLTSQRARDDKSSASDQSTC
uniref:Transmembrane protein 62 n=1 Tax=Aceria tosichella TaxID=561515 RepID=A0A6G1SK64_9ACAR